MTSNYYNEQLLWRATTTTSNYYDEQLLWRATTMTSNYYNEQVLVSRISSFICNWDRQFARTFIFLCVIIYTNMKLGRHNIVHSLAILQTGWEKSQTNSSTLFLHHIIVHINAWPRCVSSFGIAAIPRAELPRKWPTQHLIQPVHDDTFAI